MFNGVFGRFSSGPEGVLSKVLGCLGRHLGLKSNLGNFVPKRVRGGGQEHIFSLFSLVQSSPLLFSYLFSLPSPSLSFSSASLKIPLPLFSLNVPLLPHLRSLSFSPFCLPHPSFCSVPSLLWPSFPPPCPSTFSDPCP